MTRLTLLLLSAFAASSAFARESPPARDTGSPGRLEAPSGAAEPSLPANFEWHDWIDAARQALFEEPRRPEAARAALRHALALVPRESHADEWAVTQSYISSAELSACEAVPPADCRYPRAEAAASAALTVLTNERLASLRRTLAEQRALLEAATRGVDNATADGVSRAQRLADARAATRELIDAGERAADNRANAIAHIAGAAARSTAPRR